MTMTYHSPERQLPTSLEEPQVYISPPSDPVVDGFFADALENGQAACSVRVALRVRPLIGYEKSNPNQICVSADEDKNQVVIHNHMFTFDKCFGLHSR